MLLSRDCVAYTSLIKSPYGSKLPTAFFSNLCTYFSNANFLVAMRLWETPVPIPNTTVKTQAADGTALETVWESRWLPDSLGGLAQLGERLPCKQEVTSSNLVFSTEGS